MKKNEELEALAKQVAKELHYEWRIGNWNPFCDSTDWQSAEEEEVAKRILPFLEKAIKKTQ